MSKTNKSPRKNERPWEDVISNTKRYRERIEQDREADKIIKEYVEELEEDDRRSD